MHICPYLLYKLQLCWVVLRPKEVPLVVWASILTILPPDCKRCGFELWPALHFSLCSLLLKNNYLFIICFPYVLLNRSVLCNCEIKAENHFILEIIGSMSRIEIYVDYVLYSEFGFCQITLVNYFDNLTKSLEFLILLNITTTKQILPISLETFNFEPELLKASKTLEDLFNQIVHKQKIFDLQERHTIKDLEMAKKESIFDNHTIDIFLFVVAIILLLVTIVVLFIICKHTKFKSLVASFALQQIREVTHHWDHWLSMLGSFVLCTCLAAFDVFSCIHVHPRPIQCGSCSVLHLLYS